MSEQYPPNQPGPQQGPPPGWQPPPPPKKKHTVRNVLLVLTLAFVLAIGGCVALLGGIGNEVAKQADEEHTVVYKVTGAAGATKADLTYTTDAGTTTEQEQGAKLPWSKTIKVKGLFQVVQVMAQNTGKGNVTCAIEYDGKPVKTATGKGFAAIASCDYSPQ